MSTLRFGTKTFRSANMNGESPLPSMQWSQRGDVPADLPEDAGLFLNYGTLSELLPYRQQDRYDRALLPTELPVAVLENEHLIATFTPTLGGKLWSLYDKDAGRDLLDANPVVRPCNLALRNAWICGGVEWNIGMTGHSPFTCSPLFTARAVGDDGEPILRFYEFERRRGSVYQMDFSLPAGSRFLFARMRVFNPNETVIPLYWWSTVAVEEAPGSRVVVPADSAYITGGGYEKVCERPIPFPEPGCRDVTYGVNSRNSIDYFFHIRNERRYMSQFDQDGYGLVQTSSERLRGRKLFVWGQGAGGKSWQRFLTDGGKPYVEIQAGLANTQLECLPMPGRTAWEWVEAYGAASLPPERVHGAWDEAKAAVEGYIDANVPDLEAFLDATRAAALRPAAEVLQCGSGWGALESVRREAMGERPLPEHLDFGTPGAEQAMWVALLENGALPESDPKDAPASYMIQRPWMRLLEKAAPNWLGELMLGLADYADADFERAAAHFERSLALGYSVWGLYAMGQLRLAEGNAPLAADFMYAAASLLPEDVSLVREALAAMREAGRYASITAFIPTLPPEVAAHGSVRLTYANALARIGDRAGAEAILNENGGLIVPDLREGENSITDLWFRLERMKAQEAGRDFDERTATPPDFANFRMQVVED